MGGEGGRGERGGGGWVVGVWSGVGWVGCWVVGQFLAINFQFLVSSFEFFSYMIFLSFFLSY